MLTQARYAYNENSTLAVQYIMFAQLVVVAVAGALHVAAWLLGADVGLFDTPAMLTALRPVMCAMLLPGIGWALGLIASWFVGNATEDDSYRSAGNVLGQLACVLALSGSVIG